MITLAPFYKDISFQTEGTEVTEMSKIFDYKKNLYRLYSSCKKYNLEFQFEICTDTYTEVKDLSLYRTNLDNMNLMESFCVSNLEYLKIKEGKIVLCGADHLIYGKLDDLFDEDFDIGIAVVENPIRVNNTMVLVNLEKNKDKIIKFFERRYNVYKNLSPAEKKWFGDQLSFQRILEEENIFNANLDSLPLGIFSIDQLTIKLFRYGSKYVGPIKKNLSSIPGTPVMIDFKGLKRKKRIEEIYDRIMK